MGLYGERIGALHFITNNQNTAQNVSSQLKYKNQINLDSL